jgi:hypothetical protein
MIDEAEFSEFYEWASLEVMKLGLRMSTDEFIVNVIVPQLEAIKKESEAKINNKGKSDYVTKATCIYRNVIYDSFMT